MGGRSAPHAKRREGGRARRRSSSHSSRRHHRRAAAAAAAVAAARAAGRRVAAAAARRGRGRRGRRDRERRLLLLLLLLELLLLHLLHLLQLHLLHLLHLLLLLLRLLLLLLHLPPLGRAAAIARAGAGARVKRRPRVARDVLRPEDRAHVGGALDLQQLRQHLEQLLVRRVVDERRDRHRVLGLENVRVRRVVDDDRRREVAAEAREVLHIVALVGDARLAEEAPAHALGRRVHEVEQGVGVLGQRGGEDDDLF